MATGTVLHTADTCGCSVHLAYDDTTDLDSRTYTPFEIRDVCATHRAITGPVVDPSSLSADQVAAVHAAVRREQDTKNAAQGIGIQTVARLGMQDPNGPGRIQAEGVEFSWVFSGPADNRTLTVQWSGVAALSNADKTALRKALTAAKLPLAVTVQ